MHRHTRFLVAYFGCKCKVLVHLRSRFPFTMVKLLKLIWMILLLYLATKAGCCEPTENCTLSEKRDAKPTHRSYRPPPRLLCPLCGGHIWATRVFRHAKHMVMMMLMCSVCVPLGARGYVTQPPVPFAQLNHHHSICCRLTFINARNVDLLLSVMGFKLVYYIPCDKLWIWNIQWNCVHTHSHVDWTYSGWRCEFRARNKFPQMEFSWNISHFYLETRKLY